MVLVGTVNATVYNFEPLSQVSGMANCPNFQHCDNIQMARKAVDVSWMMNLATGYDINLDQAAPMADWND